MDEEQNWYDGYQEINDCHMCHQAPIDRSENRNSVLCKNCRESLIHYPVPKKIWAAAAVVFVLLIISMVQFPKMLTDYRTYATAEERIQHGELSLGLADLMTIVEKYPNSTALSGKMVRLAMKYGYYDYAAYTIDNYLVGKEVGDSLYRELDDAVEQLECYYNTMDSIQKISEEMDPDLSAEEAAAYLKDQCLTLVNDDTQDPAILYYYASLFSQDRQEQRRYLTRSIQLMPMLFDAHISLGTLDRREGNFDGAGERYNLVLSKDKYNADALRAMGILNMLEGGLELGLSTVEAAYLSNPDAAYVRETYMIALALNGKKEESRKIEEELKAAGEEVEEDTYQLMDGTITLQDYYIGE